MIPIDNVLAWEAWHRGCEIAVLSADKTLLGKLAPSRSFCHRTVLITYFRNVVPSNGYYAITPRNFATLMQIVSIQNISNFSLTNWFEYLYQKEDASVEK